MDENEDMKKAREDYERRFVQNEKVTGYGLDTQVHMPCPACAAADWLVYKLLDKDMKKILAAGADCPHCGRGFKVVFQDIGGGSMFEVVQTKGDDLPLYLPKMRREP